MNSFSAIVSIVVLASSIGGGHGCSCYFGDMPQTVNNFLHSSETVIRVKLDTDVTPRPDVANATFTAFVDYHYFEAEVLTVVKGNVTTGTILVMDASDSGRCGLGAKAGQNWLLAGTIEKQNVGDYATDMPVFSPSPCKSHNRRWAFTSSWERKLVAGYPSSNRAKCFKKDCMGGAIEAPQPCADGVSFSSITKVCEYQGDRCGYTASFTPCPAVNCTLDQDCLNGWHCAQNGLCDL